MVILRSDVWVIGSGAAGLGVSGNGVLSDAQALARAEATVSEPAPGPPVASAAELLSRLRRAMWRYGGILRDAKGTATGLGEVAKVREDARKTGAVSDAKELHDLLEVQLAARAGSLILGAAGRREESRGAHYREDFPETNEENWHGHLKAVSKDGDPAWWYEPQSHLEGGPDARAPSTVTGW